MTEPIFTLAELAKLKKQREEEKRLLSYETYLENLQSLIKENSPKVVDSITRPEATEKKEYICIKEPLEFIELFQHCSDSQDKCRELFRKLIDERNSKVIDQVIYDKDNSEGIWFNSSGSGINLRPGLKDEEFANPAAIVLGDDCVHGLVVGRTGSGKSVFLNSLLFSLMAEYSPWELNLYLADFKKVELSRYLSKFDTPHIKAVAATGEIRYVISLLTYLSNCMNARQNLFALLGLQKISEFRENYNIILPRVLFLVDEFQQLFLASTAREQGIINDLLLSITKLGRATGFHLLFASQEMTGTIGGSAFANFKARFALSCDAEVSSRILGNSEASRIDKKGIVLANTSGSKDNNQLYKVPYIDDIYFYEYLERLYKLSKEYNFKSVHKFYQEDFIQDISVLENILDSVKETRNKYINNGSSIFDIITLGSSVVFNYKKYDYETFFIEQGVRKNIGVFSPEVDDTAYICKLLAANFIKSPRADEYEHFVLVRNDLFIKKYDLVKDLGLKKNNYFTSNDILTHLIHSFKKRQKEAELLNTYHQYPSLAEFAYEALCFRTEYIYDPSVAEKDVFFRMWREISRYFENKDVKDIPNVIHQIMDDYECDISYFRILELLYQKEVEKKDIVNLFVPRIVWIIGAEMVGRFPKDMETMLNDSMNYNMLFILVSSNEFNEFSSLYKTCDYLFINGNLERYYTRFDMPFTRKPENSITVDFGIRSSVTQRSFKKFRYNLDEIIVPEINFDEILE